MYNRMYTYTYLTIKLLITTLKNTISLFGVKPVTALYTVFENMNNKLAVSTVLT